MTQLGFDNLITTWTWRSQAVFIDLYVLVPAAPATANVTIQQADGIILLQVKGKN
jgi:hypothetical protein